MDGDKPPSEDKKKVYDTQGGSDITRVIRVPEFRDWGIFSWCKGIQHIDYLFHTDGGFILHID